MAHTLRARAAGALYQSGQHGRAGLPGHDCAKQHSGLLALCSIMSRADAANALHQVPQRCARWLLMTHDRTHGENFNLSHEFLAVMLGVQRPTVSVVAATLQEAGLSRVTHGPVTVL